jgi:NitT/TauT family transport system permease protein
VTEERGTATQESAGVRPSLEELGSESVRGRRSREQRRKITGIAYPLATLALVVILWDVSTGLFAIPTYLLPAPGEVWNAMVANAPELMANSRITAYESFLGFGLSVVIGVALGLVIFLFPILGRSLNPLLISSQAIPKSAIAPLFVVWFGFGLMPKVMIAFLIGFFPVLISTVVGLTSIHPDKIRLARSLGLSPWATFFKIRLPQAAPSLFGGLKVAVTLAVVGAIVGEFVGASDGLGYMLLVANGNVDTPLLFAGLVALTVIGVGGFLVIEVVERLVIPWHHRTVADASTATM